MRVLFVQGAGHRAGAERVLLALLRHLPARGVEPVVAALAEGPFLDELESSGIQVVRLPTAPRARQLWRVGGVAGAIAGVARDLGASIVQANGEKMAVYAGWAARRAGTPAVVWLHDAPGRSLAAAAVQMGMVASPHDAMVAPSAWMARAFRRRLGVRATVIPHGIDPTELPAEALDPRPLAGWPASAVVVGHFARLQRWKGGEDFLCAAATVAGRCPQARFLVVGGALFGLEPEHPERLRRLAATLGLSERIAFLGHRSDALGLMAGCDVVVHCSRRPEPAGMVVLEGMALGRAVVASRAGGPAEMLADGRTGVLVAPRRPRALAAVLAQLVADSGYRQRLGRAAAEACARRWTAARMAEDFAALYARLPAPALGRAR